MKTPKTWDNFFVDASNQAAYKACRAFASAEKVGPQILWIDGPSGCGKTHLIEAMNCGKIVGADKVLNALVKKITSLGLEWASYKRHKLLIIDNMEDLNDRGALQENIVELIEEKCAKGQRVILVSSSPLKEYSVLNKRLAASPYRSKKTRIQLPSEELRTRFAQSRIAETAVEFEPSALEYLIGNTTMLTTIEGAVQTGYFWYQRYKKPLDTEWVKKHLEQFKGCEFLWQ